MKGQRGAGGVKRETLTSLSMQPWLVRFSCRGIMMLSKSRIICSACMRAESGILRPSSLHDFLMICGWLQ